MKTLAPAHGGRPLDEELSESIVDAALRVLDRCGYAGFSIAAVAQEAGVHRPAIYRRWPNKTDLAVAAIERLKPAPVDRSSGDVRTDVIAFLIDAGCGTDRANALAWRLHSELTFHADFAAAVRGQVAAPRRQLLSDILQRGIESDQLRADIDLDLATDLLLGLLHVRSTRTVALDSGEVERFVDMALSGLASPSTVAPRPRPRHLRSLKSGG